MKKAEHIAGRVLISGLLLGAALAAAQAQAQNLSVAVCEVAAADLADGTTNLYYLDDTRRVQLWQGTGAAPQGCVAQELPLAAADVQWLGLAAGEPAAVAALPEQLVLQGSFDSIVRVSEIELGAQAGAAPATLSYGEDLLPLFEVQLFGAEERVQQMSDTGFSCAAGSQPAGVVLHATADWDAAVAQEVALRIGGSGNIQLAVADARSAARQAPLVLGTLPLQPDEGQRLFRYRLPLQSQDWQSLTLLCPPEPAQFELTALSLLPQDLPAPRQRSAWFWAPKLWQQDAVRLLGLAQAWNLDRLFLSVPALGGVLQEVNGLQEFVAAAHARGLEVWPVLGDPRHVLEGERVALAQQVAAYLRYNEEAPADAQLDGLQLDIEPHLLPGFALAQPYWRDAWLDTVLAVQAQVATALPLDLVLPVWWGSHPAWGAALLEPLRGPALSLTIMNYRTAAPALRAGAQPFLAFGQRQGLPVSIALEAGSIGPDEERRQYQRADAGELLWLNLGQYSVLLLLAQPAAMPDLPQYRMQAQRPAAASTITFAGDLLRLEAQAAVLEQEWRSHSAYAGLALHGLDEVLLQGAE